MSTSTSCERCKNTKGKVEMGSMRHLLYNSWRCSKSTDTCTPTRLRHPNRIESILTNIRGRSRVQLSVEKWLNYVAHIDLCLFSPLVFGAWSSGSSP